MTEKILSQVKRQRRDICEEFTAWHVAAKCAAVQLVKTWLSRHFYE